jgi:hypothetical protein
MDRRRLATCVQLTRLALLALLLLAPLPAQKPDLARHLADLPPHPRLFLDAAGLTALQQRAATDPTLQSFVADNLAHAQGCLQAGELRYQKVGPRLLQVSRECLRRMQALTLAFRWTGDDAYAARAVRDLRAVAAFADWNPSHFLDVAEMTHAVALGYDWLWPHLSAEDRATIRAALIEKGLAPGKSCYDKRASWTRSAFNWNQVCNAGLAIGALAVADEERDLAAAILAAAIESLPKALASYDPDGAWMEGPGYWDYATRYTAYGLAALESALGTDFGLAGRDGLHQSGWFPILTAGPNGLFFNFADAGETSRRGPSPCLFWLARRYGEPAFARAEHQVLADAKAQPWHVVWYAPPPDVTLELPRARLFRGGVPVAVFRSGDGADALFAAVKGGYNQVNHGHLDLGSFVLDALGVRWALDLGSDDYNLPGYWDGKRGGQRWSYYRLGSRSHNVPLVGGAGQDAQAKAKVVTFADDPGHVVFDLGAAYRGVESARRGVALRGRSVLVQDELVLQQDEVVNFGLTTRADVAIGEGGEIVLRQGGRELRVLALAPEGAEWSVGSAEQKPPERTNEGVRRLELRCPRQSGLVRIAVQFAPLWADGAEAKAAVRALGDW